MQENMQDESSLLLAELVMYVTVAYMSSKLVADVAQSLPAVALLKSQLSSRLRE